MLALHLPRGLCAQPKSAGSAHNGFLTGFLARTTPLLLRGCGLRLQPRNRTMLYKFKSRATPDLIMLEPHGRQVVTIIGKAPGASGIVTAAQIPAAIAALEAAVLADEARRDAEDNEESTAEERHDAVRLRQRAAPFIEMLKRSAAAEVDVVWGV